MPEKTFHQFCPVAMTSEIVCTRWTPLIIREMICGSTRFNELRRGLPRLSPALLSRRLKELEEAGVIERRSLAEEPKIDHYHLTEAGRELEPLIIGMGTWGHRWVSKELSLQRLDAELLMWDMRRNLRTDRLPAQRRVVVHFQFADAEPRHRRWWMVIDPDYPVDVCAIDRGFDVDLFVHADLRTMTEVWMGMEPLARARTDGRVRVLGSNRLADSIEAWLGSSIFAQVERRSH